MSEKSCKTCVDETESVFSETCWPCDNPEYSNWRPKNPPPWPKAMSDLPVGTGWYVGCVQHYPTGEWHIETNAIPIYGKSLFQSDLKYCELMSDGSMKAVEEEKAEGTQGPWIISSVTDAKGWVEICDKHMQIQIVKVQKKEDAQRIAKVPEYEALLEECRVKIEYICKRFFITTSTKFYLEDLLSKLTE